MNPKDRNIVRLIYHRELSNFTEEIMYLNKGGERVVETFGREGRLLSVEFPTGEQAQENLKRLFSGSEYQKRFDRLFIGVYLTKGGKNETIN